MEFRAAFRIVLLYVFFGVLWIIATNLIVPRFLTGGGLNFWDANVEFIFIVFYSVFILFALIYETRRIEEGEARYRQLVENFPDGVAIHSEGKLVFSNRAGAALIGVAVPDDLIGKSVIEFVHQDYREAVKTRIQQMMLEKKPAPLLEEKFIRRDGTPIDVEVAAMPIIYMGKPSIQVVFRDISARKQTEMQLKNNLAYLNNLLDSVGEAIFTVRVPEKVEDRKIEHVNRAVTKLFGYTPEECVGKSPLEFYASPDGFAEFGRKLRQALAKGRTIFRDEIIVRRKTGEVFPAEITVSFYNDESGLTRNISIIRDITERKKNQLLLAESEQKYRDLVERAKDGIIIIQDGILTFSNLAAAELVGSTVEAVTGRPFVSFLHPAEVPKVADRYRRRMAGEEIQPVYESILKHGDGHDVRVEINAGLISYREKPADLVIIRDITERKKIDVMKETLFRNVSHKMKTPLAMMEMAFDMWNRAVEKGDVSREEKARKMLSENLAISRSYINDIILLFTLKGRKKPLTLEMVPLKTIIGKVLSDLETKIGENECAVSVSIRPEADQFYASEEDIKTLFYNLIDNAVKFTNQGKVDIMTARADGRLMITVRDTGRGIPPEDIKNVYERFFQSSEISPGVGLGLSICKDIAERYGGAIKIESEGPGRGTTVMVTLPEGGE